MGKDYRQKKKGKGSERFARLPFYMMRSAAWRALDCVARSLYIELLARYNGVNNGSIGLGVREAATALNVGKSVANRAFHDLRRLGFIDVGQGSTFNQKRLAREWLLTDLRDDRNGHAPRKDFMRWTPEKQNAVPSEVRIVPSEVHESNQIPHERGLKGPQAPIQYPTQDYEAELVSAERYTYRSTTGRA